MRAFVVDAFTDAPFRGNPAGVVLVDAPLDAERMQLIAAEFRHSETAFVSARDDGEVDLRWFTPAVEVDLCGHATLAAAHILFTTSQQHAVTFHTRSGALHASSDGDGVALDFPAQQTVVRPAPACLTDALGLGPRTDVREVRSDGSDLVVDLPSAAAVASVTPDMSALAEIDCRGVVVTAPAAGSDHDFVSRFFGPRVGVPEDPVTGSAHCTLGPLWSERLGRTSLVGVQLSPRGGRVGVDVDGARVTLHGRAVTVLAGDLLVH